MHRCTDAHAHIWTWGHQMHPTRQKPDDHSVALSVQLCLVYGIVKEQNFVKRRHNIIQYVKPEAQIFNWITFYHSLPLFWLSIICCEELRRIEVFNWSPFFRLYNMSVQLYCDVVKYLKTGVSETYLENINFSYEIFFWQISSSTSCKGLNR